MPEVLYIVDYNDVMESYRVEKETTQETVTLIVYEVRTNRDDRIVSRFTYSNRIEGYESPFLSWYNLIFCSNNCGLAPDYRYMATAVQLGKKTAATIFTDPNSPEGKALIKNVPKDCGAMPYSDSMIYAYHKGYLSDYFDFEIIKSLYERHCHQSIDWRLVKELFNKPLSYFANSNECGFTLHGGDNREQRIILGLILGYPVESTIEYMNGNYWQYF